MKFKNVKGDVLEFSEEEIENLIDEMVVADVIKIPKDLNNEDYYLVDEDD